MTRKSHSLPIAGIALAVLAATTGADAQTPVNLSANNAGNISGTLNDSISNTGISGTAASATVSTSGAMAATSVSGINADFSAPVFGTVVHNSVNSGNVTTPGTTGINSVGSSGHIAGAGASASVSAAGAVSSLSFSGISDGSPAISYSAASTGNIQQSTTNSGNVEVGGTSVTLWSTAATPAGRIGFRRLTGNGASATITTTGAASAVSGSFINAAQGDLTTGDIAQSTHTTAGSTRNYGRVGTSGEHSGHGASITVAGTSAISSVSNTVIGGTGSADTGFGAVTQGTSTNGPTFNFGHLNLSTGGHLSGDGTSAVISATGAASSVSSTAIRAVAPEFSAGNINQQSTTTANGTVQNVGLISHNGDLTGNGSSTAITAIGALSSASASAIGSTLVDVAFADITQSSSNNGTVRNDSRGLAVSNGFSGVNGISGAGASTAISASGAASVVSAAFITSSVANLDVGNVNSTAVNSATVTNDNSNTPNTLNTPATNTGTGNLVIGAGGISGAGASANVSASGATAATSISSIAGLTVPADIDVGTVIQNAQNQAGGTILNHGGTITLSGANGSISGPGASVNISASGATAAFSLTSINDPGSLAGVTSVAGIGQTAANAATVTNTGTISVAAGITGAGASASISSVGAGAYTSFSAIRATP